VPAEFLAEKITDGGKVTDIVGITEEPLGGLIAVRYVQWRFAPP
jgi:hypothetical protein